MAASTSLSSFTPLSIRTKSPPKASLFFISVQIHRTPSRLQTSRRISSYFQDGDLKPNSRNWGKGGTGSFMDGGETDDEDEAEDRSLDLLVQFVQNVFRKVSKRARKAVRSVLPVSISTKLVGFSVNGVIILAFLWVLKAFLEVVCTFGSLVFVSILLIRGIWVGITYIQENRNRFDDDPSAWTGSQPAGRFVCSSYNLKNM